MFASLVDPLQRRKFLALHLYTLEPSLTVHGFVSQPTYPWMILITQKVSRHYLQIIRLIYCSVETPCDTARRDTDKEQHQHAERRLLPVLTSMY